MLHNNCETEKHSRPSHSTGYHCPMKLKRLPHTIIRSKVMYTKVSHTHRRQLHGSIAEWLVERQRQKARAAAPRWDDGGTGSQVRVYVFLKCALIQQEYIYEYLVPQNLLRGTARPEWLFWCNQAKIRYTGYIHIGKHNRSERDTRRRCFACQRQQPSHTVLQLNDIFMEPPNSVA